MMKAVRICTDNGSCSSDDSSQNSQKEIMLVGLHRISFSFYNNFFNFFVSFRVANDSDYFLDEENIKIIRNKLSHLITSACQYISERYAHLLSKRSLTDDV